MLAPPDVALGGAPRVDLLEQPGPQEGEWWFQPQTLVRINTPSIIGDGVNSRNRGRLERAHKEVFNEIGAAFAPNHCPVVDASGSFSLTSLGQFKVKDLKITTNKNGQTDLTPTDSAHAVLLNPVYAGKFPKEVQAALKLAAIYRPDRDDDGEGTLSRQIKDSLRVNMPEVRWPLVDRVGEPVCESLGITPRKHPNMVNVWFFSDPAVAEIIGDLPQEWGQWFRWGLMGKGGTYKEMDVFTGENGEVDKLTLFTLEGASPVLPSDEAGRRLLVFGSADRVGDNWKEYEGLTIPYEFWKGSHAVQSLKALGKYAGEQRLLPKPIVIKDVVNSAVLERLIRGIANYSSQAAGAYFVWSHDLPLRDVDVPWDGITTVSKSGKFGAVKTDPKPEDLLVIIPSREKARRFEVDIVPLQGHDTQGPSVEAGEFTGPMRELAKEDPEMFLTRFSETPDGKHLEVDPNGNIVGPYILGAFHSHTGAQVNDSGRIREHDPEEPAVPCGTNLTFDITKKALRYIVPQRRREEATGGRAIATVIRVENHGDTTVIHYPKGTVVPKDDFFAPWKEAVNKRDVIYHKDVPQR